MGRLNLQALLKMPEKEKRTLKIIDVDLVDDMFRFQDKVESCVPLFKPCAAIEVLNFSRKGETGSYERSVRHITEIFQSLNTYALQFSKTVHTINMSRFDFTRMSKNTLKELFLAIEKLSALQVIDFSYSSFWGLDDEMFSMMCNALKSCKKIRKFELRGALDQHVPPGWVGYTSNLSSDRIQQLCEVFVAWKGLESFTWENENHAPDDISAQASSDLLKLLKHSRSLKSLNLGLIEFEASITNQFGTHNLGDANNEALCDAVQKLPWLTRLEPFDSWTEEKMQQARDFIKQRVPRLLKMCRENQLLTVYTAKALICGGQDESGRLRRGLPAEVVSSILSYAYPINDHDFSSTKKSKINDIVDTAAALISRSLQMASAQQTPPVQSISLLHHQDNPEGSIVSAQADDSPSPVLSFSRASIVAMTTGSRPQVQLAQMETTETRRPKKTKSCCRVM